MLGLGKIVFGILLGLFVIPVVFADPVGTFETVNGIITKLSELGSAIGGAV